MSCNTKVGSWRTRHLKVRSDNGDWDIVHKKGEELVADLGTKVMGPLRVEELKKLMNLERMPEPVQEKGLADDLVQRIAEDDAGVHGRPCPPSICSVNFEEDSKKIAKLIAVMRICQKIRIVSAQPDAIRRCRLGDHLRRPNDGLRSGHLQDVERQGCIRHSRVREGIERIQRTMAVESQGWLPSR